MEVHSTNGVPAVAEIATPMPGEAAAFNRDVVRAVHAVNASEMFGGDQELTFHMDLRSKRLVIRLVKRTSGEVVRQIPADYVLELARDLRRGCTELYLPADEGV